MALQLRQNEDIDAGIRRVIAGRIDAALRELQGPELRDRNVHNTRKRLKEIRGVLRLVRPALRELYKPQNRIFRDAARPLSALRDARILIAALDSLTPQAVRDVRETIAALQEQLRARKRAIGQTLRRDGGPLDEIRSSLSAAERGLVDWPALPHGWRTVGRGLKRVYRDGRRAMARAVNRSDENLHEWRKQVKWLWYQLEVLEVAWPPMMQVLQQQAHHLSDLLGDIHDLAVLRAELEGELGHDLPRETREQLLALIQERRSALTADVFAVGQCLYLERPSHFVRRIRGYWKLRGSVARACDE